VKNGLPIRPSVPGARDVHRVMPAAALPVGPGFSAQDRINIAAEARRIEARRIEARRMRRELRRMA
jgi:hypothetical protein